MYRCFRVSICHFCRTVLRSRCLNRGTVTRIPIRQIYRGKGGGISVFTTPQSAEVFVASLHENERELLREALRITPYNQAEENSRNESSAPPSVSQLRLVAFHSAVPFIGFGLLDNAIMIIAGEYIDYTIGMTLGISTMAAAALGNIVSDVSGIGLAHYVEAATNRLGFQSPKLSSNQAEMPRTRFVTNLGRAFGIVVGCFVGMFPLLFYGDKEEQEEKDSRKTIGMDKTIQRGDLGKNGILFKIVPMHYEMKPSDHNFISCWYKPLPKWLPRAGQSVIPTNLSEFKFVSEEMHRGMPCLKYERKIKKFNKSNTYSFYISKTKPHRPLRYEMVGYDDMLTSHYDRYILDYVTFEPWKFNRSLFNLPKNSKCEKKAKKLRSHYLANPMAEYLHFGHHKDRELERSYKEYRTKHAKNYATSREHEQRKHIFKHNLRFIRSKNRENLKYKLAPNNFADMTEEEITLHRGLLHDEKENKNPKLSEVLYFNQSLLTSGLVPDELDWRDYGAVTRVHSQGLCGSCWTFSAVGAVEGAHFLKTGELVELSNQQLIDCSWPAGNRGCRGGFQDRTLKWVKRNGVALRRDYGPYLAQEGFCHCGHSDNCTIAHISGFSSVKKNNSDEMKLALVTHGPIASSVNADTKTFRFYSHGIYDDSKCGKKTNHAILTVGYGSYNKIPYWVIKNSWGHLWGDNGYIKITMKNDRCGLLNGPLLAVRKDRTITECPLKTLKKVQRQKVKSFSEEELTILPF